MAGRIYEEPGAPKSESAEALQAKRRAHMDKRRRSREPDYVSYPAPADPQTLAAATSYVQKHGGEHADLLLDMLGLIEGDQLCIEASA